MLELGWKFLSRIPAKNTCFKVNLLRNNDGHEVSTEEIHNQNRRVEVKEITPSTRTEC